MESILIAGCGYLGTTAGALLAQLGYDVAGLRRDPSGLPPSIAPLAGDVTAPRTLALAPVDALVYCAAPDERGEDAYRSTYLRGLDHVLAALERAGRAPRRAIFVSSTAVWGQNDGSLVDESSATEPADYRGAVLLEAEALLGERVDEPVALRLGGLYGPGRTRLIESVLNGESDYAAHPPSYTNRIHRDDAALALAHLLELEAPAPVYAGVDEEPAARGAVLTWLAARLDAPRPRAIEGGGPRGGRGAGKRVSSARLRGSGLVLRYPTFREGYEHVIAAMGPSLWNRTDARDGE